MQKFTNYFKEKSNNEDFISLFESEAKFKPTRPQEAQRKQYFSVNLEDIMRKFMAYLIREQLVPAKSEKELLDKLDRKEIQHSDMVVNYVGWLDLPDTTFAYEVSKPKPTPVPKPAQNPQPTPRSNNQAVGQPKPSPAAQKSYTPKPPNQAKLSQNQVKKQAQMSASGPYIIEKVYPRQQPPVQRFQHVPQASQATHTPHPQAKGLQGNYPESKKAQYGQPIYYNIAVQPPMYPEDNNKAPRVRFYEKLADLFEFPQRSATIRQELINLMAHTKK